MLGDEKITHAYDLNAEYWISMIRSGTDQYQTQITDPALIKAIGDVNGLDVLDAGCGEGYLARKLSDLDAASVTGVDTCAAFINSAIAAETPRCRYILADVAEIPLADASLDLIIVNRLPHGLAKPAQRYREFFRLLRPSGRLILIGQHPCFYSARTDDDHHRASGVPAVHDYFGGRVIEQHLNVGPHGFSPVASVQKLYSLEQYVSMIISAGFVITAMREPRPTAEQFRTDPKWEERFARPLFLVVEAKLNT